MAECLFWLNISKQRCLFLENTTVQSIINVEAKCTETPEVQRLILL